MSGEANTWCDLLDTLTRRLLDENHTFHQYRPKKMIFECCRNQNIRKEIMNWLQIFQANVPVTSKSSIKSRDLRNKGNERFAKGNWEASVELYSESIIYAPTDSPEFSLALGNRSAVLFRINKFEKCIEDIDLAVKTMPPDSRYMKLMIRKGKALLRLERIQESEECFSRIKEKLSSADVSEIEKAKIIEEIGSDSNPVEELKGCDDVKLRGSTFQCPNVSKEKSRSFPFASCLLDLQNETSSRKVIATEDIRIGDVLIVERPFSFVVLPEYSKKYCQYCFRLLEFPIACCHCTDYLFCNYSCFSAAYELFHKWECPGVPLLQSLGVAHLVLKTALIAANDPTSQAYEQVNSLMSHLDDVPPIDLAQYTLTATLLVLYLESYTDFFTNSPWNSVEEMVFVVLNHLVQVICNAFAVKKLASVGSDFYSLNFSTVTSATGVYPSAAMLNHSCDPNIITSFYDNLLIIRARENIRKGEEVFNCYGPYFTKMKTKERKEILRTQFFFDCNCKRCILPEEDRLDLYLCSKCNSPISLEECKNRVECQVCHSFTDVQYYQKLLKKYNILREKGDELMASANFYEAARIFEKSKNLLGSFLDSKNIEVVNCNLDFAECCYEIGDYNTWWKCYESCVSIMKSRFGSISIEYLEVIKKLIQNYLSSPQTKNAEKSFTILSYLNEMIKITELNFGSWSSEYSILLQKKAELIDSCR